MICSKVNLSLEEKGNRAKILYTDSEWYLHRDFFHFFEYMQFSLFYSIPVKLLRDNSIPE
jgi:hypothetical protein